MGKKEKVSSFEICYSVGMSLELSLIDIRGFNNSWYRFKSKNLKENILIKYVEEGSSSIAFEDISVLFTDIQSIIIVHKIDDNYLICSLDNKKIIEELRGKGYIKLKDKKAIFFPTKKFNLSLDYNSEEKTISIVDTKNITSAASRYKSILKRSFLQKLAYVLYTEIKTNPNLKSFDSDSLDITSNIEDTIKEEYEDDYNDMKKIRERNEKLYVDGKSNNKLNCQDDLKEKYNDYYQSKILTFDDFYKIWNVEDGRNCLYCGIKENQIETLSKVKIIKTKRFYSRGKTMEIDKIDAFGDYEKDNIILSCYWCNNAKTDEYTLTEFKEIAKGINFVWNNRLSKEGINNEVIFPKETYIRNLNY